MAVRSFCQGAERSASSRMIHQQTEQEDTMSVYGPKQLADSMRTARKNIIGAGGWSNFQTIF